jgi:hypothetical protein
MRRNLPITDRIVPIPADADLPHSLDHLFFGNSATWVLGPAPQVCCRRVWIRAQGFEPPTNRFRRLKSVPTALYLGLFGLAVDAGRKRLVWPREHAHRAAWSPCVEPDDRPLVRLGGGPGPRQTAVRVSRLGESCLKGEAKAMVESRRPRGWARMIRNRINGVPRQFDPGRCCRASRKGASSPTEVGLEHWQGSAGSVDWAGPAPDRVPKAHR